MELLTDKEVYEVYSLLRESNPHPQAELEYSSPYTLLVAVVLSAQTTDKSVNKVTRELFKVADTPSKMIQLTQDEVISYIKCLGLSKSKSQSLLSLSKDLVERFHSVVPDTVEELTTLRGVGRKTANVVLNVVFHKPTIPVDTHIKRISPKIGLCPGSTAEEVEKGLLERTPEEFKKDAHHWLLLHGRYVCTARSPKCDECVLNNICKKN